MCKELTWCESCFTQGSHTLPFRPLSQTSVAPAVTGLTRQVVRATSQLVDLQLTVLATSALHLRHNLEQAIARLCLPVAGATEQRHIPCSECYANRSGVTPLTRGR